MKHKKYIIFIACEGVLMILLNILLKSFPVPYSSIFAFPFEQIANALLLISKTGRLGNGFALALMVGISAIPAVIAFIKPRGKASVTERIALCVTSVVMLPSLYGMVNPYVFCNETFAVNSEYIQTIKALIGLTLWSLIIVCVVLRGLFSLKVGNNLVLRKYMTFMLYALGALFIAIAFSTPLGEMIQGVKNAEMGVDKIVSVLHFVAYVIPSILNVWICVLVVDLIHLYQHREMENIPKAAGKVAKACCYTLGITVCLTALMNVVQMAFMNSLYKVNITANIPILGIAFSVMILFISRLILENQNLREDNDLFI